jgi:tRNA threonylcarbamoyladenosine biosynthesis protein TsaE
MLYKHSDNCIKFENVTLTDLQIIALKLSSLINDIKVFCLNGDLGTGKTTFSKFFINSLIQVHTEIPSPTFTLVQTYKTKNQNIYHFDLYRLKYLDEAYEIGIEEALMDGISLIEWPNIINELLPEAKININLLYANGDEERTISIFYPEHIKQKILAIFDQKEGL